MSEFDEIYLKVRLYTIMSRDHLCWLWHCAQATGDVVGAVAELGVYRGGSAMLLASACPSKAIHVFDTFKGLPSVGPLDAIRSASVRRGHLAGDFTPRNPDDVLRRLQRCGISAHSGEFPKSADLCEARAFAFAHFDADTYSSAVAFLKYFAPRMQFDGVMLFHDYGWVATPGVKVAVDLFMEQYSNEFSFDVRGYQAKVTRVPKAIPLVVPQLLNPLQPTAIKSKHSGGMRFEKTVLMRD